MYVLTDAFNRAMWDHFPELASQPRLRRRVVVAPPSRSPWKAAISAPLAMLTALALRPLPSGRYLVRSFGGRRFQALKHFYLDTPLLRLRPDIIHFEFGALAPSKTYLKERMPGVRLSVSFRGYDISYVGLPNRNYYDEVWKVADGVHFLGDDLLARARQRGFPASEVFYMKIPPAVDISKFPEVRKSYSRPPEPLRILSVGRLEWKKGYEYALLAAEALRRKGVPFEYRIVGEGAMAECLYLLRHRLGLESAVHLLGAMPHAEVIEQLKWADVLLHASVSEGFCNAVQEAQAMKVPPVTSDAEGLAENVVDGVTGFVVPRRNPAALADKLELLYRSPHLREQMGQAGRRRIIDRFTLDQQAEAFDRFYQRMMNTPPR